MWPSQRGAESRRAHEEVNNIRTGENENDAKCQASGGHLEDTLAQTDDYHCNQGAWPGLLLKRSSTIAFDTAMHPNGCDAPSNIYLQQSHNRTLSLIALCFFVKSSQYELEILQLMMVHMYIT